MSKYCNGDNCFQQKEFQAINPFIPKAEKVHVRMKILLLSLRNIRLNYINHAIFINVL